MSDFFQAGDPGHITEHNRIRQWDIDTFPGADLSAQLVNFMTEAGAQTYPPAARLSNQLYNISQKITDPYTGFRIQGPLGGAMNSELDGAHMTCKVKLSGLGGPWLNNTSDVYNTFVSGLGVWGDSSSSFIGGPAVWHGAHFRDLSFHQMKSVIGTQAQKALFVASTGDGWFQVQGTYEGGIHMGGSDSRFSFAELLIDASTAFQTGSEGDFHIWLDGFDNSAISGIYITAEAAYAGVKCTGTPYNGPTVPANLGMCTLIAPTIEGRNAGAPCDGALVRVEGGQLTIIGGYIARAMSSASTMGHSPIDAGACHVEPGGALDLSHVIYDRYTGQAETVPFVYNNGGYVDVSHIRTANKGGQWSGRPRVQAVAGTTFVNGASVTNGTTVQV